MKLSELSTKDVIREEDGTKLGRINDVIIVDTAQNKNLDTNKNNKNE